MPGTGWRTGFAHIQAGAIETSRVVAGIGLFNTPSMKTLAKEIESRETLQPIDRENLEASLDGLSSLANSLFSVAIDDSQQKLALFGLFFAVASIFFSSFAVLQLAEAHDAALRVWVLVSGAALFALVGLLVAAYVVVTRRRRKER